MLQKKNTTQEHFRDILRKNKYQYVTCKYITNIYTKLL